MDRSTRRTLRRKRCDYGTPAHLLIASRQGKTGCRRGGRRQRAFSAYRAIGGPMAKPAREWHGGKVESGPTRWESVSPFVKLTDNPTSTAGRGPFSAKRRRKRLRRKEYTIRVN